MQAVPSILWLRVDGWPWAVALAAKVATGKTMVKGVEHYVEGYPFWDAVGWAVLAVDTPCAARQGYEGVLEHVTVRFVARCSRICTHELVRHRLASYSQTSTRLGGFHATGYAEAIAGYCRGEAELEDICVLPEEDWVTAAAACRRYLERVCGALERGGGKKVDDALRYGQPDALAAHIMVTTNLREALHILSLRLHPHAHWEIRGLARGLASRLWEDYGIPVHLMLLLKRPGLAALDKELREHAMEQLELLREHNPRAAAQVEKIVGSASCTSASQEAST